MAAGSQPCRFDSGVGEGPVGFDSRHLQSIGFSLHDLSEFVEHLFDLGFGEAEAEFFGCQSQDSVAVEHPASIDVRSPDVFSDLRVDPHVFGVGLVPDVSEIVHGGLYPSIDV